LGRLARPTLARLTSRAATTADPPPSRDWGPRSTSTPCVEVVGESVATPACSTPRETLDRVAAGPLRAQLVGEVARKFARRPLDEIEDAFHEAYTRALTACHWQREREVYGWLRRVMINWLIDRERRGRLELVADTTSDGFLEVEDARAEPLSVLGRRQELAEIEDVHVAVLEQLSERQRDVVSLHARGTERKEIARRVAASENAIKKDLKRAFRVARQEVIARSGHGCPDGEPLIIRYAFGLGGKAIPAEAQLHLAHCDRCGQFFRELEAWREKVASLMPLPAVEQASPGAVERGLENAMDVLGQVKQTVLDGGTQLKNQAAASYYRAVDPTPLATVRPGAATAAVATCLGIVGGATYCVDNSLNPVEQLAEVVQEQPVEQPEPTPSEPPSAPPPAATPPATSETPPQPVVQAPPPAPAEPPAPAPEPPPPPPPEPTPAPVQFGEPASTPAQPTQAVPPPSSLTPAEPAPAPAGGSDLYGP
jgi:RNA polymerase sigma factor (sigma-70 family)